MIHQYLPGYLVKLRNWLLCCDCVGVWDLLMNSFLLAPDLPRGNEPLTAFGQKAGQAQMSLGWQRAGEAFRELHADFHVLQPVGQSKRQKFLFAVWVRIGRIAA
jgi:hypothetical protein